MHDCVIIGGGIAGLTAGVELAQKGVRVLLVEEKPHFGGRAYSFTESQSGDVLDNGQHLIMGCYSSFLHFLRQIGAEHKIKRVNNLRIPFRHIDGRESVLHAQSFPKPFGFLRAVMRFDLLSFRERLSVLRFARTLELLTRDQLDVLDDISVFVWISSEGQSENTMRCLWNVICLATLNADMRWASAKLFAVVLREIFFGDDDASSLMIPTVGLSDLYVHDAVKTIEQYGGTCIAHNGAQNILWQDDGICGVILRDNRLIETSHVIFAVPTQSLRRLLPIEWHTASIVSICERIRPSEIRSYHLWSDQHITEEVMTCLVGSRVQWIFAKGKSHENQWTYTCVVSAAEPLECTLDEECSHLREELYKLFPQLSRGAITRVKRIIERAATFRAHPGLEPYRLSCESPFSNAFFAGDWTATHLPATLEGAVRSGYTAAAAVYSHIHEEYHVTFPIHSYPSFHE